MKKISAILAIILFMIIFVGAANAQTEENSDKIIKGQPEYDENLVIKKKPAVKSARTCLQSAGITIVRVTFDKSAAVTETEVIYSSGCEAFDKNAVSAAKKIKFKPAIKNGEPITIDKMVQYSFRIY